MENTYSVRPDEQAVLELSSVLENAPYLLSEGEGMPYADIRNMSDCKCKSTRSSSPCRATSVEYEVNSK